MDDIAVSATVVDGRVAVGGEGSPSAVREAARLDARALSAVARARPPARPPRPARLPGTRVGTYAGRVGRALPPRAGGGAGLCRL